MNQQFPEEAESDMFWFGCEWPYNYSKDQLVFGPFEKYTLPISRGFKLLQGSCEEVQSKDQVGAVRPFAYAVPQLSLKSAPGDPVVCRFSSQLLAGLRIRRRESHRHRTVVSGWAVSGSNWRWRRPPS